ALPIYGPRGDRQHQVVAPAAVAVAAHPGLPLGGPRMRAEVEVEQGVYLGVHHQDDVAAGPAVPPVGPAERLELLAVHGRAAVPTVPGSEVEDNAVDEPRHGVGSSCWS